MRTKATSVIDVLLGEAVHGSRKQRLADMKAIASVIANRAKELRVSPEEVISAPGEFTAYGKTLPAGVEAYRDLAKQALAEVQQNGPVHSGTFYATPSAKKNLPSGLQTVAKTTGHIYFDDPKNRAIETALGYRTPDPSAGIISAAYSQPYDMAETGGLFGSPSLMPAANAGPAGRAYGDLVPPTQVETTSRPATPEHSPASTDGLLGGWSTVGNFNGDVDPRLADIMSTAAKGFPDYATEAYSGYRPGDPRQHGKHRATDVRLVDPKTGTELANYQTPETFRTYEKFAQEARRVQQEKYPDLNNDFRWGGYFSGPPGKYGAADLMHFDLGGLSGLGMAGGAWDTGLTEQQRAYYPGAESIGLAQLTPDNVPPPESRPLPDTLTASAPDYQTVATRQVPFDAPGNITTASFAQPQEDAPNPFSNAPAFSAPMAGGMIGSSAGQTFQPANVSRAMELASLQPAGGMLSPDLSGVRKALEVTRNAATSAVPQPGGTMYSMADAVNASAAAPPGIAPAPTPSHLLSPEPLGTPELATPADFPAAPPEPTRMDKVKSRLPGAMKRAAVMGAIGGLPGAAIGLASGLLGGEGGLGSGLFDGPGPIDKFSVGSGLKAMERAMSGARGATARASNGTEYTSLGPGMGGIRTSGKYGWSEMVGPDGSTRAGGNARGLFGGLADAFGAGGGLMGDRPGGLGGLFGGLGLGGLFGGGEGNRGGFSKADRDKYGGRAGLW